ncbi:MAG TPA: hemerythrin domain-containing protein [Terriglobia bacterium]|nr:hemerythrin domain-containing protein [Terriglobia bacterium]
MQLLAELRAEHDLIDRMLDSFRTAVSQLVHAQGGLPDLVSFVRFFRIYADQFHHSREEQVLFATLVNQLHLPGDHGPIAVMTDDHRQFKAWLDQIEQLIAKQPLAPADQIQLRTTTEQYITAMQHHIDAENSVLFVEGEICLQDAGISELPSRSLTADEQQVRLLAEELLQRYSPAPNVEVIRGDGCVICPAYQKTCDGYEREWAQVSRWGHAEDDDPFSDG